MKNHHRVFLLLSTLLCAVVAYNFVPPPGPAQAQFVGQATYGGTSGGAANVQTITVGNYTSALPGVELTFLAGFTNTGPMTINVTGLGAVSLFRSSSIGPVALSGAEVTAGELVSMKYDGTRYVMTSSVDMTPIGKTIEYRGSATPRGSLIEDGSCVSRATYAPLFAVIGTTYAACDGSTTFGVPDSRGTVFAALDTQGANGAANRITSAITGCNATVMGATICGTQTATLTLPQIPSHLHAVFLNDPGHTHTFSPTADFGQQGFGSPNFQGGTTSGVSNRTISIVSNTTGITVRDTTGGGGVANQTATAGSGSAHSILNPILLGRRAIKY